MAKYLVRLTRVLYPADDARYDEEEEWQDLEVGSQQYTGLGMGPILG